jgi:hypothetical protein
MLRILHYVWIIFLSVSFARAEGIDWRQVLPGRQAVELVVSDDPIRVIGPIELEAVGGNNAGQVNTSQGIPGLSGGASVAAQLALKAMVAYGSQAGKLKELEARALELGAPYAAFLPTKTSLAFVADAVKEMPEFSEVQELVSSKPIKPSDYVDLKFLLTVSGDNKAFGGKFTFTVFKDAKSLRSFEIHSLSVPVQDFTSVDDWVQSSRSVQGEFRNIMVEAIRAFLHLRERDPALPAPKAATVRYLEGARERFERAEILGSDCGRLLGRNLRGVFLIVPESKTSSKDIDCAARAVPSFK